MYNPALINLSFFTLPTLPNLLVTLQEPYIHKRHYYVDRQQQHSRGSPLPQVELPEYLVVDAKGNDLGAPTGATACEGEHHIEGVKGFDRHHHQIDEQDGSEQGQHHAEQPLPGVGPVHLGSLHYVAGEGLQPSVDQDHAKSRPAPDVRNRYGGQRKLRIREEWNGLAGRAKDVVQYTRRRLLVENAPNDADNHPRDRPGGEYRCAGDHRDSEPPFGTLVYE